MSTTGSPCDSLPGAHGIHNRDGSLLRRKQEQWQKERSESATWFPFGSPGGGAPNQKTPKYTPTNSINSPDASVPINRFNSPTPLINSFPNSNFTSNEHVIENTHILPYPVITSTPYLNSVPVIFPESVQTPNSTATPYYFVTSPGNKAQTPPFNSHIILQQTPSMISGVTPTPISLAPAASIPSTSTVVASSTYLPSIQSPNESNKQQSFVFANTVYGHPIPVELIQGHNGQVIPKFPFAIPIQHLHSSTLTNQLPSDPHPNNSPYINNEQVNMTSYTEHWANQLPHWGKEISLETGKSSLPPINMNHSYNSHGENVSQVGNVMNNDIPSKRNSINDLTRAQQIHDSMSSLNSAGNKNIFVSEKDRRKQEAIEIQMTIDEQLSEKRRLELLHAEQERRESERIAQEHAEREALRKKESEHEQNRWKEKLTDQEDRQKAMLEKLEEAKRESEALKKAKLYRHVLQATEAPQEIAQKILGTPDSKEAQKVLKQVDELAYQKRMEMEQLYASSPGSSREENKKQQNSGSSAPSSGRARSVPPKSPSCKEPNLEPLTNENATPLTRSAYGRQSLRTQPAKNSSLKKRSGSSERPTTVMHDQTNTKNPQNQKSLSRERRTNQLNLKPSSQIPRPISQANQYANTTKELTSIDARPLPTLAKQNHAFLNNDFMEDLPSEQPIEKPNPPPRQRSASVDKAVNTSSSNENDDYDITISNNNYRGYTPNALKLIADLPNKNEPINSSRRHDIFVKPIGLFEPVQTRARNMRQTSIETPIIVTNEISTSPNSSSPPLSAGYESGSSPPHNSPAGGSRKNSDLVGQSELNGVTKSKFPFKARSNLTSNLLGSNSSDLDDPSSRPPASPFVRRLAETNSKKHISDYLNSNENNRRNLQSPTMMRLQSSNVSINNINPNDSEETSENEHQSHSRSTTPKPFNCRTSQYRSLNLKRNKERQEEILKQLANLRMQLKDKQTQMERTWSNQSLARSATTGSMLHTLNKG